MPNRPQRLLHAVLTGVITINVLRGIFYHKRAYFRQIHDFVHITGYPCIVDQYEAFYIIIPAPTVSKVLGSIKMTEPV